MDSKLSHFIGKLNSVCRSSIQKAAELCVSNTHYTVELEHFLFCLLETTGSEFEQILQNYKVDGIAFKNQCKLQIDSFKRGNQRTPSMSPHLVLLLEESWKFASIFLGFSVISSGAIFAGLFQNKVLRSLLLESLFLFKQFSLEDFEKNYKSIVHSSTEFQNLSEGSPQTSATSVTPYLDQYTIDLTNKAKKGELDPVIGRDKEIFQMIHILGRRRQNNPIITGEAGVGKTAVVEGLAHKIVKEEVPDILKNTTIRCLDLGLLQAGAGVKGEFEQRLKTVIQEVQSSVNPILLFIDEVHSLVGAGGEDGRNDAANLLKPALARGELRTIGATTWAEYKKYFEKDPALTRRFQPVQVLEPSPEVAIDILLGTVPALVKHHKVKIEESSILEAVKLSHRYISSRKLPDKAISLLDTACSRVAVSNSCLIDQEQKERSVDSNVIASIVSDWTGIPTEKIMGDSTLEILNLQEKIQNRFVGQSDAIKIICKQIYISYAKLEDPQKPVGVFLLTGPSGIGKTETALALADLIYGGEHQLIQINLSEYQEAHSVSGLKGSPPGYVGYGAGGILTEAVRRKPFSVILLDEVEKAHPDVLELFYQVFDKGIMEDAEGTLIDFKNTLILLTSNIGSETILRLCNSESDYPDISSLQESIQPELKKYFKSAFLGRMVTLPYYPLKRFELEKIINLKLNKIQKRFQENYQANLQYDATFIQKILDRCNQVEFGARNMDSILNGNLLPQLAEDMLLKTANKESFSNVTISTDPTGNFLFIYNE